MKKEITLQRNYGSAKKGTVYIRGLHDVPDYYKKTNTREDFYWEKGSKRDDNYFLMIHCLTGVFNK